MNRPLRILRLAASSALALALAAVPAREAAAAPERAVFALVVGNNRSVELGRPELRYADDDSAKYYEVFRMLAPEESVHLLTELDADSARLFPDEQKKAQPPTREAVKAAAAEIGRAAREARQRGAQVDFYFTFAGHGDVDEGKGFLELRDGRFTADDVEAMLRSIPATRSHVILDSCNSFFVLNARKPGGSRIAVTADAARSLSDRLPNVGVFLSTSSEAEVFEWSELQSGIFSHAVRSGILGGADANGDGDVSYDELRAFVEVASEKVKNPLFRPHVFARGPGGDASAPLFPLRRAEGTKLELDPQARLRLTVRDADAQPWIDVHKEQGAKATLRIPTAWAARATVEEREVNEAGSRVLRRYSLDGITEAEPLRLAALTPTALPAEPRGANEALRMLFAAPFGPRALAAYAASAPQESADVYGVSRADAMRMRDLMLEASAIGRSSRYLNTATNFTVGGVGLGGAVWGLATGAQKTPLGAAGIASWSVVGALGVGAGVYGLIVPSPFEKTFQDFATRLGAASPAELPGLAAAAETQLLQLSDRARRGRYLIGGLSAGLSVLSLGLCALSQVPGSDQRPMFGPGETAVFGSLAFLGAVEAAQSFLVPSQIEIISRVWAEDAGRRRLPPPSLAFMPVQTGSQFTGGVATVGGVF